MFACMDVLGFVQATLIINTFSWAQQKMHKWKKQSSKAVCPERLSGIGITLTRSIPSQFIRRMIQQAGGSGVGRRAKVRPVLNDSEASAVWGLRPTVFLGPDAIRNIQHISYTVNFSWTASVPMKIHSFSSPSTLGAFQASLSIHGKVHRKRRRERFNCKVSHSFKNCGKTPSNLSVL